MGITTYAAANRYLADVFVPDFNSRFTVVPAQRPRAFVPVVGLDLPLLLSAQHERVVRNDSTVTFNRLILQLPPSRHRPHSVRCPVLVHEFPDDTLGLSYQGRLLARYSAQGRSPRAPAGPRIGGMTYRTSVSAYAPDICNCPRQPSVGRGQGARVDGMQTSDSRTKSKDARPKRSLTSTPAAPRGSATRLL